MATITEIIQAGVSALRNKWRSFLRHNQEDPVIGSFRFGDFASTDPVSHSFGFERGTPIDRYYIANFLRAHKKVIKGHVLEVGEATYTRTLADDTINTCDVLHYDGSDSSSATIIGDLCDLKNVSDGTYDCLILTQTLQFIPDMSTAVTEMHRILKPGGSALVTFSGISQISRYDADKWGDYWRVTEQGARHLFDQNFGIKQQTKTLEIKSFGNVYAACSFLQGLALEEIERQKLDIYDADYPVLVGVWVQKA